MTPEAKVKRVITNQLKALRCVLLLPSNGWIWSERCALT
jgi:hypothetical protein